MAGATVYLDWAGVLATTARNGRPAPHAQAPFLLQALHAAGLTVVVLDPSPIGIWGWLEEYDLGDHVDEVRQPPPPSTSLTNWITARDLARSDEGANAYETLVARFR